MSDYMYNSYYIWSWATLQGYLHIIDKLLEAATLKWKVGARSIQGLPLCSARLQIEYHLMMASKSPLQNSRYILRVAGWKLIITGKPLVLKRNAQMVDLPWLLHDAVYNHSERWLPSAKPAEAMGGEYISMILNLQWIIVFEETSEISSEISAEFGFFLVSTKMKTHWACASIFRQLKSYIISFLNLFASFVMAIFCCWGKTRVKSGIDRNIYL